MKTCPSSLTPARACPGRRCGRWKLLLIAAAALLGIASLTGCSEDVIGPEDANGTYLLAQVEDKAMPAQFVDRAGSVMAFSEGVLTMHADGSCTSC